MARRAMRCIYCGAATVWLENPVTMGRWEQILVEVHGIRDGVKKFWHGEVFYDPAKHSRHYCEKRWMEQRLRWKEQREEEARRKRFEEGLE